MSGPDDQTLIARAQRGDRDAFGTLATRHRDAIYSFAVRMLGDREQALDAAQEIFIRAYTKLDTFDQSRPWRPWLFTIAANTCTDLLRRSDRRADTVDHNAAIDLPAGDASSPHRAVARMELQRRVAEALQCLSHIERTVVALKHIEGFTYQEISGMTDIPVGTLKSHAHRGRRRLTGLLQAAAREDSQ